MVVKFRITCNDVCKVGLYSFVAIAGITHHQHTIATVDVCSQSLLVAGIDASGSSLFGVAAFEVGFEEVGLVAEVVLQEVEQREVPGLSLLAFVIGQLSVAVQTLFDKLLDALDSGKPLCDGFLHTLVGRHEYGVIEVMEEVDQHGVSIAITCIAAAEVGKDRVLPVQSLRRLNVK